VSLASHPPQSARAPRPGTLSTDEIPLLRPTGARRVVHTGNVVRDDADRYSRSTGPVDFVPRPVDSARDGASPSSPPASRRRPARRRAPGVGLALVLGSAALLEVGLLRSSAGRPAFWATTPLWSAFVTAAALLGLVAFVGRPGRIGRAQNDRAWKVAAAGLVGVSVFWVLAVLPVANTDRGLVLTAALVCLGAGLALAPSRSAD
jgi:hypothetical protein